MADDGPTDELVSSLYRKGVDADDVWSSFTAISQRVRRMESELVAVKSRRRAMWERSLCGDIDGGDCVGEEMLSCSTSSIRPCAFAESFGEATASAMKLPDKNRASSPRPDVPESAMELSSLLDRLGDLEMQLTERAVRSDLPVVSALSSPIADARGGNGCDEVKVESAVLSMEKTQTEFIDSAVEKLDEQLKELRETRQQRDECSRMCSSLQRVLDDLRDSHAANSEELRSKNCEVDELRTCLESANTRMADVERDNKRLIDQHKSEMKELESRKDASLRALADENAELKKNAEKLSSTAVRIAEGCAIIDDPEVWRRECSFFSF